MILKCFSFAYVMQYDFNLYLPGGVLSFSVAHQKLKKDIH